MLNLINTLFFCRHKKCTFPMTRKPSDQRSGTGAVTGTYYVCLDCGKEFAYDWHAMEVVGARQARTKIAQLADRKITTRAS